jgi:hypothetical protein
MRLEAETGPSNSCQTVVVQQVQPPEMIAHRFISIKQISNTTNIPPNICNIICIYIYTCIYICVLFIHVHTMRKKNDTTHLSSSLKYLHTLINLLHIITCVLILYIHINIIYYIQYIYIIIIDIYYNLYHNKRLISTIHHSTVFHRPIDGRVTVGDPVLIGAVGQVAGQHHLQWR